MPPYFTLGFDQNMMAQSRNVVRVTIGELRTVAHLCKYGRPLWNALFPQEGIDEVLDLARLKLTNGETFDSQNPDHVLAVLSQRLCIDLALAAEAMALADRSVACHMRLLIGVSSSDRQVLHTHSPSEPVLALGAVDILYKEAGLWKPVLNTFSKSLCESGLVDKGFIGELAARTLLLVARDFTERWGRPFKVSSSYALP